MKLIYSYIKSFKNIRNQEVTFSDDYDISFGGGKLRISRTGISTVKDYLYGKNPIRDLHIVIGRTGSGKTNLMQVVGMEENTRLMSPNKDSYFLLYESKGEEGVFVAEMFNIHIPDVCRILNRRTKVLNGFDIVKFRYDFIKHVVSDVEIVDNPNAEKTVIVNAFDRYSFCRYPYSDVVGQVRNTWLTRKITPFNETFPASVIRAAKEYVGSMPEGSMKRKASLIINRQNWQFRMNYELDEALMSGEYWLYGSRRQGNQIRSLTDVPYASLTGGFTVDKDRGRNVSDKEKFIHDLLTDYAIYLRKTASSVQVVSSRLSKYRPFSADEIENPKILPDGQEMPLLKRINWLCQYIDWHTDEKYGNKGLLWQIGKDIRTLAENMEMLPDKYFTPDALIVPLVEIDDSEGTPFYHIFEVMGQYHRDQTEVFPKELLPYELSYLSSGEYQAAKIWGALMEAIETKIHTADTSGHRFIEDIDLIVLMDEPENYLHPEFCRQFIDRTIKVLSRRHPDRKLQIIITTHSPFMLSDTISSQVTRVDFDEDGECVVLGPPEKPYFAANIHSIMADGFFLDYTIGEFSRLFLVDKYNGLRSLMAKATLEEKDREEICRMRSFLPYIGDKMIRMTFAEITGNTDAAPELK